jgi:hypothetical protein
MVFKILILGSIREWREDARRNGEVEREKSARNGEE